MELSICFVCNCLTQHYETVILFLKVNSDVFSDITSNRFTVFIWGVVF